MSIASVLHAGRRAAESRMLDTCEIRRPSGRLVQDEDTGAETPTFDVVAVLKCRVAVGGLAVREQDAAGRLAAESRRELHVPVSSPELLPEDQAVITAVGPLTDPTLNGATLILAGPVPGSQTTARRLQVTEVLS